MRRLTPESKTAASKRQGRELLISSCAVLLLVSVLLSYALAGDINSFLEGIMGKEAQGKLGAPFVEELLKPLGLVILAAVFSLAKRLRKAEVGWPISIRACYAIGYASGLVFGLLENWLSYGTFSGLRGIVPFSHAFGAGMVSVGICYLLSRGKWGLGRFASLYSAAVLLHFAWNNISATRAVLGVSETVVGLTVLLASLQIGLRRRSSAPPPCTARGAALRSATRPRARPTGGGRWWRRWRPS